MDDSIRFYLGEKRTENGKTFSQVLVDFSDHQEYFDLLFPREVSKLFFASLKIRKLVCEAVFRVMYFYGFIIKDTSVKQVKPLSDLVSLTSFRRVERMLSFLSKIDMTLLSSLVFLCMCRSIENPEFYRLVKQYNFMPLWKATQPYLQETQNKEDEWGADVSEEEREESIDFEGEESDEESPFVTECSTNFRGLEYTGNSCYQDSVLLALFALPNRVMAKNILENRLIKKQPIKNIQKELCKITASMRGLDQVKTCSGLRKMIKEYPGKEDFHKTGTQDAGEFLQYLFELFDVHTISILRKTVVTNSLKMNPTNVYKTSEKIIKSSPIFNISAHSLAQRQAVNISSFLEYQEDAVFDENNYYKSETGELFRRRIETVKIVKASYIVFYAQRTYWDEYGKEKRNFTYIVPQETITIEKRVLRLHAIITHVEKHYTCYINCEGKWFWYDDNPGPFSQTIQPVGSFYRMLNSEPNPQTKGNLFFYV